MHIALAVILLVHGFAHVPGVVPWRLATPKDLPYKTTLFAGLVDVGDGGIRVVGILWLAVALALGVCAAGVLARMPWWTPATLIAASLSLILSIAGSPDSRVGVFVNLALLAFLLVNGQVGWLR
jgi:hypothetical protein